uniref:Uncharacterized protein LOC114339217 n=1 Tax=Diabrotica virgifera virgifera TaxID=50390 RepID=A0A6P7G940_DIAVI
MVNIQSDHIETSNSVKFLGIYIDQYLQWDVHLLQLCKKLNSACYSIRVLKEYLQQDTLLTVYYANFYSQLRYGIMFWGSAVATSELLIIQKKVIRIILGMKIKDSCRGKFKLLNILTFPAIYIYECLKFLFKNPLLFNHYIPNHTHHTRALNLTIPRHRLTLTERSPLYACIKFHNKLPSALKQEIQFGRFKRELFKYLVIVEPYTVVEYLEY